jgi:hypothetical protein
LRQKIARVDEGQGFERLTYAVTPVMGTITERCFYSVGEVSFDQGSGC